MLLQVYKQHLSIYTSKTQHFTRSKTPGIKKLNCTAVNIRIMETRGIHYIQDFEAQII